MMTEGPRLEVVLRSRWLEHLKTEDVEAWYHVPKLQRFRQLSLMLAPRGYSRGDNLDAATPEDLVRLRLDVYELGKAYADGHDRSWKAESAAMVAVHEYLHCLTDWTPTEDQLELLEHPTTAWPALQHAFRRHFPVNAFTGVLRWHWEPGDVELGLDWLRTAVPRTVA